MATSGYSEDQDVAPTPVSDNASNEAGGKAGNEAAKEVPQGESAGAGQGEADNADDIAYNDVVYLTEAWQLWENQYLKKLGKRIHRMCMTELSREEVLIFMLYQDHDKNLDGELRADEAKGLLTALEKVSPGISDEKEKFSNSEAINFLSLLRWHHEGGDLVTAMDKNLKGVFTEVVGSGVFSNQKCDQRLDKMEWVDLRRNVVGYRKLLSKVREFKDEHVLAAARKLESSDGLEKAMPAYYDALAKELDGDGVLLFELFSGADTSGNMLLEESEVRALLKSLDPKATEKDLGRYTSEINLADGPLSYASFVDWWDQARNVPNSLVAEKGGSFIAGIKAKATQKAAGKGLKAMLGGESEVKKDWKEAQEQGRLTSLRRAYCKTLIELREYKMERDLRALELSLAK